MVDCFHGFLNFLQLSLNPVQIHNQGADEERAEIARMVNLAV